LTRGQESGERLAARGDCQVTEVPNVRELHGSDAARATDSATVDVRVSGSDVGSATEAVVVHAEFLSTLAASWVWALEPHLEFLLSKKPDGWADPAGQKSGPENGHAAAAVVMGVFLLESMTARIAVIRPELGPPDSALSFVKALANKEGVSRPTEDELTELFVARDVLAHNHIWELALKWASGSASEILRRELLRGGDKKYQEVVVSETGRTRSLDLHVVPTFVGRQDAAAALTVVVELLDFLARFDFDNTPSTADSWIRAPHRVRLREAVASLGWTREKQPSSAP
jgi:hypothetical protein